MKETIFQRLQRITFLFSLLLFLNYSSFASHLLGGEITWQCQGNGQYIFQIKAYRDCNGIPLASFTQINVYGHPTVCSIPINPLLTVMNDISPSSCIPTCLTGGAGTTQELIFTSDPVSLPGIPPSSGWVFAVDNFGRADLMNLNGGQQGLTLRSIMYPYNNTNADPCFDSSPFFC